jgi:chromosome segregation ATPase
MPEAGGEGAKAGEGRRVVELLRVNGELAAEIRALQGKRTGEPRSAAMPAARRVGRLSEERDSLVLERDSLVAELQASRVELEALEGHATGLGRTVEEQARHIEALSHEVERLRGGAAGLLRRFLARLSRSPRSAG